MLYYSPLTLDSLVLQIDQSMNVLNGRTRELAELRESKTEGPLQIKNGLDTFTFLKFVRKVNYVYNKKESVAVAVMVRISLAKYFRRTSG